MKLCLIFSLFMATSCYKMDAAFSQKYRSNTVAIVTNVAINKQDIKASPEQINRYTKMRKMQGESVDNEVAIQRIEMDNLQQCIIKILWPYLRQAYPVTVNEQEIELALKDFVQEKKPYEFFEKQKESEKKLLKAIDMVYLDQGNAQAAYEKYLMDEIDFSTWESELKYYANPTKREKLRKEYESHLTMTKPVLEKTLRTQVKRDVEDNKLRLIILNKIAKSEHKAEESLEELRSGKQGMNSKADQSLKKEYATWWKSTFMKEVSIKDHAYDKVFDLLEPLIPYISPAQG